MGMLHTTHLTNRLHTALAHSGTLTIHRSGGAGIVHKVSLSFIASVALPPPPRRLDQRYETARSAERARANFAESLAANFNGHVGPRRV